MDKSFVYPTAFLLVALWALLENWQVSGATSSLERWDLRDKSLLVAARDWTRKHPGPVHQLLVNVVNLIRDDEEREKQLELLERTFADTLATKEPPCSICRVLANIVRIVIMVDGYEDFEKNIMEYCRVLFNALDPTQENNGKEMCNVLKIQGVHIAKILATIFSNDTEIRTNAEDVCRTLNVCYEIPDPDSVLMGPHDYQHHLPLSSRSDSASADVKKDEFIKIAQISDVHIEFGYAPGSNEHCPLYVCCLDKNEQGNAGAYGSYECNIPVQTMELFIDEVIAHSPNMILFSGDVPPHKVWDESRESQLNCSRTLTSTLREKLTAASSDVRVYPSIGNHDMFPTNLFSINHLPDTSVMVQEFVTIWRNLADFGLQQSNSMRSGGYYTILTRYDKLRIVSLNSEYMYTLNYYNVINHRLRRLVNDTGVYEATTMKLNIMRILEQARNEGEKVILINHHPPGGGDYLVSESRWYEKLVVRYSDIIVLQVAGHTHTDEFRLFKDSNNVVHSMLYVNPSIDTSNFRNPSMRLYYLDPVSYKLINYEQYYFDIPTSGNAKPEIKWLYNAQEEYGLDDMSSASWENVLKRFETDHELLMVHRRHSYANAEGSPPTLECDSDCRRAHICRQLHANYDHYEVCAAGPIQPAPPTTTISTTWPPRIRNSSPPIGSKITLIVASLIMCVITIN